MGEESRASIPEGRPPRLLDQVAAVVRRKYFSRRTGQAYAHWIKRFIFFSGKRHPKELGAAEVTAFLNHLASDRNVAAGTQNQALSAVLFLYKEVLGAELGWLDGLQRPSRPPRLPVVPTRAEVERLLAQLTGTKWLIASLLYGAGLRVMECLRLRVKDVDLSYRQILVRDGKGEKDRVTMLPGTLVEPLRAGREWCWQYVFPSKNRSTAWADAANEDHSLLRRDQESAGSRMMLSSIGGSSRENPVLPRYRHAAHRVPSRTRGGDA